MQRRPRRECRLLSLESFLNNIFFNTNRVADSYILSQESTVECGIMHLTKLTNEFLERRKNKDKRGLCEQVGKHSQKQVMQSKNEDECYNEDERIGQFGSMKNGSQGFEYDGQQRNSQRYKEVFGVEGPEEEERLNEAPLQSCKKERNEKISYEQEEKNKDESTGEDVNICVEEGEDLSYEMTDYSSNESSNDNDYNESYRDEPLFGGLFTQNKEEVLKKLKEMPKGKFNFLNTSPKKEKRLYIRHKKVPKWAEDLERVAVEVARQKSSEDYDPNIIYGKCVVEHLNTNIIFHTKEKIKRFSSAKWNMKSEGSIK